MERYDNVSMELARQIATSYSTSFSKSSALFSAAIRPHIFNIYAWLRIGDEIADTYRGQNASELLGRFRQDTVQAMHDSFSTNPIIHAFSLTASTFGISHELIDPFIHSMAMDLKPPKRWNKKQYDSYIHGSAEVVGLMCLKVFVDDDKELYARLQHGAESLGSAFQKINYLRDFAYDTKVLNRSYFPNVQGGVLTERAKSEITADIRHDLTHALPAIDQLPHEAKDAVLVAAKYYGELLAKLESTPVDVIMSRRIRIPDWRKTQIFASAKTSRQLKWGKR